MINFLLSIISLSLLCFAASPVLAGGMAPGDAPPAPAPVAEKITATPAQTATAVDKARRAVAPQVEEVTIRRSAPQGPSAPVVGSMAVGGVWALSGREGGCQPLSAVEGKTGPLGSFATPQQFARQLQQRGHRAFVLDIGDLRDQLVRVKVPDFDLDVTFVRQGLCR
jgi:hypothetical protein